MMTKCPKYNTCSAPICPLDKDWKDRVSGGDECQYVRSIRRIKIPSQMAKIVFFRPKKGLNSSLPENEIQ